MKFKKTIITFSSIIILYLIIIEIIPNFINIRLREIPYSTLILDDNGIEIGEIPVNSEIRHRKLDYEDIPEFMISSIVAIEDQDFFHNNGIDYSGLARSTWNNIKAGLVVEGGSTISSQVIRNNYWLNEKRSLAKKIQEFYLALALNKSYTKEEILLEYLNGIYFGYLNYGVKSASQYYFGKDLNNLTKAEQISLLTIPRNPNIYNPYKNEDKFKERFNVLVDYLGSKGIIEKSEIASIKSEKLMFLENYDNKLPYISDFIKRQGSDTGGILQTTIDYHLTKEIENISFNSILPMLWKNVTDYSVVIIDKHTKEMKVMIGGVDYNEKNGQVNSCLALRQPGSTLKPFTYLLAFEKLGYTPDTTILDLPVQFKTTEGYSYTPRNYSLDYKGEISLAESLSQSINIPAVKITDRIGVDNLLIFLRSLGITSLNKESDYYGLALTLGVGEVNLYELLRAYSIFAYDGEWCDTKYLSDTPDNCEKIVDKKYTDMVELILTNRYFKLGGFPVNSTLDIPDRYVFVKTGTSRNFRDNWSIGFTENYLIGVWVGNKDGSEMKGVSGATGAGEIFRNIVYHLETNESTSDIIELGENNLKYTTIISPLPGSKYQINLSKPLSDQKIKLDFFSSLDYDNYYWTIGGERLGGDFWGLREGFFEIKLILEKDGKEIGGDEVRIEVN